MNLVEKHLEEKILAREKREEPDVQRLPVTFTEDEQQFLDAIKPAGAESLTPEKGENDDDFWERKALANLPRYDYLDPKLLPRRFIILLLIINKVRNACLFCYYYF